VSKIPYSDKDLFNLDSSFSYGGRNLDEIAFPLGGIGTGSISLGGWGQLRDWEIMNRPAKGYVVPLSFFTLKVHAANKAPVTKVLQGPVGGSYVGDGHSLVPSHGKRDMGEGLPHFREVVFKGTYPIATLELDDPDIPVHATLEAFNPFIPLNDKDSSIPVAVFIYSLTNKIDEPITAMICGNLTNVIGEPRTKGRRNEVRKEAGITGLFMANDEISEDSPRYGTLVLATTCPDSAVWPRWSDSRLSKFWEAIALSDKFPPDRPGQTDTGTVAANVLIEPSQTARVVFILAWHFPTFEHYWARIGEGEKTATWRNFYAAIWRDAWDVAKYTASNFGRLWKQTKLFRDTLFSSTLPIHVLDAVSSQLSTLKTTTCLRLEDGTFYGFEGSSNTGGCCEGSCTHVWNYAQALPYLFPKLQRSMLNAHLENSVQDDGFMTFRMPLPLGIKAKPTFHPAADGQMGFILQIYRQWLISGDDKWLRSVWPTTKKLLEFAWKYWDADKDGVMEGMQHNTYDIEFYGPNTMAGSLYLAALRAAQRMAEHLGEHGKAEEYYKLFKNGSRWTDEHLFNGEYYEQKVNPKAHETWPEHYQELTLRHGKDDKFTDWPKWQFGKGCLSDQLIGQWYAKMLGLGYLYDPRNIRETLRSIFKYNWKPNLWNHPSLLRIYALNDEAGLIVCTWPKGERPGYAFYFADEVWCGIEYQVASHMLYENMVKEGLAIVKGIRDRHRGDRRNPWDEFECGHHYARSMASYALLLALSGFRYSAPEKILRFEPKINQERFVSFFSTATGWGLYSQKLYKEHAEFALKVRYGLLHLERLELPRTTIQRPIMTVTLDGKKVKADLRTEDEKLTVLLGSVVIKKGQMLTVLLSSG